jgi:hypothetical protein
VLLLSVEEKTTKYRDQIVVLPELARNKLTDDTPSLAALSRVVLKLAQRCENRSRTVLLPAATSEGGSE